MNESKLLDNLSPCYSNPLASSHGHCCCAVCPTVVFIVPQYFLCCLSHALYILHSLFTAASAMSTAAAMSSPSSFCSSVSALSIWLHIISNLITDVADFLCHLLILTTAPSLPCSTSVLTPKNNCGNGNETQATNWPEGFILSWFYRCTNGVSTPPCSLCLSPHNSVSLVCK